MTDDRIVDLYLARDEQAISETSDKYGKKLYNLSRQITGDGGVAEECVNDTYMETWEKIPPHEPRNYLYAFVARITRMLSLGYFRKQYAAKRHANVISLTTELEECVSGTDITEQVVDDMHFKESLNSFLAGLTLEKRDIFIRRYWYMDDIAQIAGRHRCKESRITTMLMRLRKALKEHLETDGIRV